MAQSDSAAEEELDDLCILEEDLLVEPVAEVSEEHVSERVSSPVRSESPSTASDTSNCAAEEQENNHKQTVATTENPDLQPEADTPSEETTDIVETVSLVLITPVNSQNTDQQESQTVEAPTSVETHLSNRAEVRSPDPSCPVTESESIAVSSDINSNPTTETVAPNLTNSAASANTEVTQESTSTTTTDSLDDNNVTSSETDSTMGENLRVEEKLRQFQQDSKQDEEDTRGTYNSQMMSEADKQRRRNLIFDEERFEETFLKCLICREVYNEEDKLPKMLHCHHTFCLDCLLQMYRVEGEFRQSLTNVFRSMPMTVKIQCPTCREGLIISEPELRRLPNDHTIMELLFFVNQTGKNEVQYCTKHQMQPLNFFCEPCIMPVCCDCTVIDHKESKGHLVVNVDEAMKKYTPIVEETLGDIRAEKSVLAEKRLALENAQDDMDQIQRDLNEQIRSVFDNIRQVLEERERELYDAAAGEIEKKRVILDGHLNILSDRESQLNAQFNDLQKAKDERDISQLFSGHKTAREVLARPVFVPTNSTKGFSVTFQFSSRSDNVIKQQIANLGDIIFQS